MLSSVLKSKRAIQVNIQIMRTFTQLRKMLSTHEDLKKKIESMEKKYDEQFQIIFEAIKQLLSEEDKPKKAASSVEFSLKPQARKIWNAIPSEIRMKILNNVWCANCSDITSIGSISGKIEKGMLVLRGICTRCGGSVARVLEDT